MQIFIGSYTGKRHPLVLNRKEITHTFNITYGKIHPLVLYRKEITHAPSLKEPFLQ